MSELVIVERMSESPFDYDSVQALERQVAWCLEQHAVTFLHSYLSRDGTKMICIYRAPDAEAVRATQRTGGLPVERAWAATLLGGPVTTSQPVLIAERSFEQPVTSDFVTSLLVERGHCMQTYDVSHRASYLARDGRRMVCAFMGPDAEAVRTINRQIGFPVERVWAGDAIV